MTTINIYISRVANKKGFTRVKRKVQSFADMTPLQRWKDTGKVGVLRWMLKIPAIYGLLTPLSLAEQ